MEVGSLSTTPTTFATKVVWNVLGFKEKYLNSNEKQVKMKSPSFYFCQRWWYINLRTDGKEKNQQHLEIYLQPEKSGHCDILVNCELTLLVRDSPSATGDKITSREFTHEFHKGLDSGLGFPKFVDVKAINRSYITVEVSISGTVRAEDFPFFMDEDTVKHNLKLLRSAVPPNITVTVEEREFVAHKDVLTAHSKVFQRMFNTETAEVTSGKIAVLDAKAEVFEKFLDFLYTGTYPDNFNVLAEDLFALSHKYEIKSLERLCISHFEKMDLDHKAAVSLLLVVDKYPSLDTLQERIVGYLTDNLDFLESAEWEELKSRAPGTTIELLTRCIKREAER